MGSCFSCERSSSPLPRSPKKRKSSNRRPFLAISSFDRSREEQLHRDPNRRFLNGSTEIASLFSQKGKKGINQDAMIVWENFGSRTDTVFCGVFDGHGPYGHMVAKQVRDSLPLKLSEHLEVGIRIDQISRESSMNSTGSWCREDCSFLSANEETRAFINVEETVEDSEFRQTLRKYFRKAFKVMDRELRTYTNFDCLYSGTTAVALVKQGQNLVIGNVGDSRAVLARRDENNSLIAVQLTVDLKPNLPAEEARIKKCKGRVFSLRDEPGVARVWLPKNDYPGLAMSRAFGDFCLKDHGVISVPQMSYRRITDEDEFIVLATDGVWDVLSNEEVVEIVSSCPTRSGASRTIVETAVKAWKSKLPTSRVDDCAAVCLFLTPDESNASPTYSEENTPSPDEQDEGPVKDPHHGLDRLGTFRIGVNTQVEESKNETSEINANEP